MMTPEEKELRSIYNFYKDTKMGFFTKDGYAAVPCGCAGAQGAAG